MKPIIKESEDPVLTRRLTRDLESWQSWINPLLAYGFFLWTLLDCWTLLDIHLLWNFRTCSVTLRRGSERMRMVVWDKRLHKGMYKVNLLTIQQNNSKVPKYTAIFSWQFSAFDNLMPKTTLKEIVHGEMTPCWSIEERSFRRKANNYRPEKFFCETIRVFWRHSATMTTLYEICG